MLTDNNDLILLATKEMCLNTIPKYRVFQNVDTV